MTEWTTDKNEFMKKMVPGAGVEPARRFSPRDFKSLVSTNFTTWASGAGNEARTRDINLGKVTLYQLSYSRLRTCVIIRIFRFCAIIFFTFLMV